MDSPFSSSQPTTSSVLWLVSTRAIQASRLSISAPSILASTDGLTAFSVREHDGDDGWQSRFRIGALGLLPYTNHIAKQTKWHAHIGIALMLEEQIEAAHGASNVGAKEQIALPFFQRFVDVASGLKRERVPVGRFDECFGQKRLERDGGVLRLREHSFTRAFWFPYRERERRAELSSSRRWRRRVHVRALTIPADFEDLSLSLEQRGQSQRALRMVRVVRWVMRPSSIENV